MRRRILILALAFLAGAGLAASVPIDIDPLRIRAHFEWPWASVQSEPAVVRVEEWTPPLEQWEADYVQLEVEAALCKAVGELRQEFIRDCGEPRRKGDPR